MSEVERRRSAARLHDLMTAIQAVDRLVESAVEAGDEEMEDHLMAAKLNLMKVHVQELKRRTNKYVGTKQ